MRKTFLIGVAAQIIIVSISLVLKNDQIIMYGNIILLVVAAYIVGAGGEGKSGWEYVGLKNEEIEKLKSYRSSLYLKILLFILPGFIVMGIYFMYNGFSILN